MGASVGVLLAGAFGEIKTLKTEETSMYVEVKQKHIRYARAQVNHGGNHARCCPIAQAVRELLPDQDVVVTASAVKLNFDNFPLSLKAKKFIQAFDGRKRVAPFRFRLPVNN